jgi:hypothetical protein
VLLPCLIGIGFLLPAYQAAGSRQQSQAEMAVVKLRFDEEAPVIEFNRHSVDANPCDLRFYPGRYVANVTYLHEGQRYQFEQVIELKAKEHKTLDLAPAVREDIVRRSQGVEKGEKPSDKTP